MARRSFRDRFFTPQTASAITSPVGVLLFGGVTAGGIIIGAPIAAAFGIGAAAWAGSVALRMPRNPKTEQITPTQLTAPWRDYVMSAQDASRRFDRLVADMSPGPLRDRIDAMSSRMDDGVAESWRIAKRGDEIDAAIRRLPTDQPRAQLAQLQAEAAQQPDGPTSAMKETMGALQAQIDSAERLQAVATDAQNRLRLLDARFDELVARAVEVSVGTGDSDVLGNQVDDLVDELEALRLALDDTQPAANGEYISLPPPTDNSGN